MTIAEEFAGWIKACYPEGLDSKGTQYRELRRAFYAGALIGYSSPEPLANELFSFADLVAKDAD